MKSTEEYKQEIIDASRIAVDELIKVLKEPIITNSEEDVSSDKLKNSAATKKLAMTDAFEMIARIDVEQTNLNEGGGGKDSSLPSIGFAEKNAK